MELYTQRLKLVPCTADFISTLRPNDYELGDHITSYLKELEADPGLLGWGVWFVVNKEDNSIIGDIGFKGKPDENNIVETGYGIVPSAQQKGYATEAVKALIDWAFSSNPVNTVIAECTDDNVASIKVLEKLGMTLVSHVDGMYNWELHK